MHMVDTEKMLTQAYGWHMQVVDAYKMVDAEKRELWRGSCSKSLVPLSCVILHQDIAFTCGITPRCCVFGVVLHQDVAS